VSQRQTTRIAAASHGASPKLLATKYRILRASALLATGQATDWRDAGGDDFVDQAHFIRNFRRFVGQPPAAFNANDARLARLVMRAKWDAGARSPLALWS
jgi:methylphosphotriester-DNA--protein-cysteine methyltransferase